MAEGVVVEEQSAKATDRAKVEITSQRGVSTQLEYSSAHERVGVRQLGSPSILMSASQVAEPSPTTELLSGKALIIEVSLVQVLSLSSEEHGDYSGDEVDFGDELALSNTSKFSHIFEKEM